MTKKRTFRELIDLLFIEQLPDLTNQELQNVPYLHEMFWKFPQLANYLNEHINDLFNIPDNLEQLKLLRKIIKQNHISRRNLWQYIPQRSPNFLKEIQEQDLLDEGNARAKLFMLKQLQNNLLTNYIKPAPTKQNANINAEVHTQIKEVVSKNNSFKKDSRFLSELSHKIIDEEELILFDVSLIKKRNQVLFIFIDKNNQKRYWLEPFSAKIFISNQEGVIHNDYIETYDPNKHTAYQINDINLFTRLKFSISKNYTEIVNGY